MRSMHLLLKLPKFCFDGRKVNIHVFLGHLVKHFSKSIFYAQILDFLRFLRWLFSGYKFLDININVFFIMIFWNAQKVASQKR